MTTPNPYQSDSAAPEPGPYGTPTPYATPEPGPYGTPTPYATPEPGPYGTPTPYAATGPYDVTSYRPTNQLATIALILSLVGFGTWVTAPAGAICGHVALRQIRENPNQQGHGVALAAVIIGWTITGLGILAIVWFFVLIAQLSGY